MQVLSVDGGGYLGLATASFIAECEEHFNVRFSEQFDLFCGTSTGAIICLGLATGMSGIDLVRLYEGIGPKVFGKWSKFRNAARTLRSVVRPKHSHKGLKEELDRTLGTDTLGQLLSNRKKHALITAFNTSTGSPRIFKTKTNNSFGTDENLKLADIALASASAPTYFPLTEIQISESAAPERFCDGGVAANHPALIGFAEAVNELKATPSELKILSLATPRISLAMSHEKTAYPGLLHWAPFLASILIDSNSELSHQVLLRLVAAFPAGAAPTYCRVEFDNLSRWPIDRADKYATDNLKIIGKNKELSQNNIVNLLITDWDVQCNSIPRETHPL